MFYLKFKQNNKINKTKLPRKSVKTTYCMTFCPDYDVNYAEDEKHNDFDVGDNEKTK